MKNHQMCKINEKIMLMLYPWHPDAVPELHQIQAVTLSYGFKMSSFKINVFLSYCVGLTFNMSITTYVQYNLCNNNTTFTNFSIDMLAEVGIFDRIPIFP